MKNNYLSSNNIITILFCFIFLAFSCNTKNKNQIDDSNSNMEEVNYDQKSDPSYSEENTTNENGEYSSSISDCGFEDDTYSATVEYSNSETGYSATYTLDVDVEDCQVVQINFPNDGYLDEDHISPTDLDDGYANVSGENGKSYEIQINN